MTYGLFVGRLHRRDHEHTALLSLCEKRSQQFLLLLAGQVFVMRPTLRLVAQHGLTMAYILRLQLPDRLRLPAQHLGDLRSAEAAQRPKPDALNPLLLRFAFSLPQKQRQAFNNSLGKRLECTHFTPPHARPSLLLLSIDHKSVSGFLKQRLDAGLQPEFL